MTDADEDRRKVAIFQEAMGALPDDLKNLRTHRHFWVEGYMAARSRVVEGNEAMTVDTDPAAEPYRETIAFLRENATALGVEGNDDREALSALIHKAECGCSGEPDDWHTDAADAILAAGFRRSEPTEPSDAEVLAGLNAWYSKEREQAKRLDLFETMDLNDYSPQSQDRMRAALKAAAEASNG